MTKNISLCPNCHSMTKTINNKCGKCGSTKMTKDFIAKEIAKFNEEFGIHFKNSSGELKFANEFLEEAIQQAEKRGYEKGYWREQKNGKDYVAKTEQQIRKEIIEQIKKEMPGEKDYRELYGSPDFNEVPKRFPTEATFGYNSCRAEVMKILGKFNSQK